MNTPTFKDLYEWVLAHKGTRTFMGYSDERVMQMLYEGLRDKTIYYHLDLDGKIIGMILAIVDEEKKILFVTENLAMSLSTLKIFAAKAKEQFKGYKLQAIRHCKHRKWNTDKFYNKLTH